MGGLARALVGAAAGFGEGLQRQAEEARETALARLKGEYDLRQEQMRSENKVQEDELAHKRRLELAEKKGEIDKGLVQERAKYKTSGGGGLGARSSDDVKLSSGMLSRIERRFKDDMGGETDYRMVDEFSAEVRRYIADNDVSEDQAFTAVSRAMEYEDEEVVNDRYWFDPRGDETEMRTNREGRGTFKGFNYGDGQPSGLGAGSEESPRDAGTDKAEVKPMPSSPEQLQVGAMYRHPKTGETVRWDGSRFVVVE